MPAGIVHHFPCLAALESGLAFPDETSKILVLRRDVLAFPHMLVRNNTSRMRHSLVFYNYQQTPQPVSNP